ncbi:Bestrophin, RFP-TM, chloride channel [compost metagenome]
MIIKKNISLKSIFRFSGQHLLWMLPWMLSVPSAYYFLNWKFLSIPWQPLSMVGTAVAFYVGFKNNQSYDRLWEARKIWGTLVNSSRKLAVSIKNYKEENEENDTAILIRKEIVYRHIAYLYQLRKQLLKPTPWEHVSLNWVYGSYNQKRRNKYIRSFETELEEVQKNTYLSSDEIKSLEGYNNKAVHLLDRQSEMIQKLFTMKAINQMQQIDIQSIVNSFYDEQGKTERIKNFPFPRQYAGYSFVFVSIFIFLLPFGIVGELSKMGNEFVWLGVPLGVLIGWIYLIMEMIGDYSENPFEGLQNDIPMLTICRNIEIDLLQIINDSKNIPSPIMPIDGILI